MPKFPEPPAAAVLAGVPAEVRVLPAGSALWRLYFRGGSHPNLWDAFRAHGPVRGRFDHQLPPAHAQLRKILYAAEHGPTCLAEVFQDTRLIDREAREPWLVAFEMAGDVPLLDMTGSWPTRAGASMAIATGPRPRSQRWSRAVYDAYPEVEGIYYLSSMHGSYHALALYERAQKKMPLRPLFHRPLLDPALLPVLKQVAFELGYGLV